MVFREYLIIFHLKHRKVSQISKKNYSFVTKHFPKVTDFPAGKIEDHLLSYEQYLNSLGELLWSLTKEVGSGPHGGIYV